MKGVYFYNTFIPDDEAIDMYLPNPEEAKRYYGVLREQREKDIKSISRSNDQKYYDVLSIGDIVENPQYGRGKVLEKDSETLLIKTDFIVGWCSPSSLYKIG